MQLSAWALFLQVSDPGPTACLANAGALVFFPFFFLYFLLLFLSISNCHKHKHTPPNYTYTYTKASGEEALSQALVLPMYYGLAKAIYYSMVGINFLNQSHQSPPNLHLILHTATSSSSFHSIGAIALYKYRLYGCTRTSTIDTQITLA